MNWRGLLLLSLLGLLAWGGWTLQEGIQQQSDVRQTRLRPHDPDYFMRDFTTLRLGPDGRPASRLRATAMRHYPADGHAELDAPRMQFHPAQGKPWRLRADTGRLSGDHRQVDLRGRVLIEREPGPVNRALKIVTRDVVVYPERDFARSDADIRIDSPGHVLQGTGFKAWLRHNKLEILSNVRSRHDP